MGRCSHFVLCRLVAVLCPALLSLLAMCRAMLGIAQPPGHMQGWEEGRMIRARVRVRLSVRYLLDELRPPQGSNKKWKYQG